jgi:hypothetical protein
VSIIAFFAMTSITTATKALNAPLFDGVNDLVEGGRDRGFRH